ncbi:MAG: hypothetical protein JWN48_5961 [Myxococcaceae bacterium]|nr:hypothetical protein [Myxococcaceae bacterium]
MANDPATSRGEERTNNRRFLLAMRLLAGLSALVALLALWSVEGRKLSHDLQLAAEPAARPGDRLALRALLFRDVEAPEGASLALAETVVRLRDARGRELASTALQATALDTLDGSLQLPATLAGEFTLEARAHFDETDLVCARRLTIDPRAPAARLRGREAGPLQHLSLGAIRPASSAPQPMLPRVIGGACIPGEPCRLLVWVGAPAAALSARVDNGAELLGPASPSDETAGIVELRVLVRGPDAQLTLEARRAGKLVGERPLRLPVGLGEVGLSSDLSIVGPGALELHYLPPPGRSLLTFDSFARERWSRVAVVASADAPKPYRVAAELAAPGLFRVQARADRLSAEGSGARVFYVRSPGEGDLSALWTLARTSASVPELASEPTAAWAAGLPAFATEDPARAAAFLLAGLETFRAPVPLPVSGRPAQLRRLAHTRSVFRFGVSGALVLSAIAMALSLARRGIVAADEAQSILDLARSEGDNEVSTPRPGEVLGARLRVLLLALAVAAAFLAAALLIAAKPLWF